MRILIFLLLTCLSVSAQTNVVTDPSGNTWAPDSDMGFYWTGFGVGLMFYGFGWILGMAKKTTNDF